MANAYEIPNLRFSLPAGGVVHRYRFVAVDAAGAGIQSTAATQPIGAAYNEASAAGKVLEVADGIVIVEAGAAVVAGEAVASDADGKAIPVGAGIKAGVALTGGGMAPGSLITVKIA